MNKRFALAMALCLGFFLIWQQVGRRYGLIPDPRKENQQGVQERQTPSETSRPAIEDSSVELPATDPRTGSGLENDPQETSESFEIETVILENEKIKLVFSNQGAVIKSSILKNYYNTNKKQQQVSLVSSKNHFPGEIILKGQGDTLHNVYEIVHRSETEIEFVSRQKGLEIRKNFQLTDGYRLNCKISIDGTNDDFYMVVAEGLEPLKKGDSLKPSLLDFGSISPKIMYVAWSENGDHENKIPKKLDEQHLRPMLKSEEWVEWAGVKDAYFANVFMPEQPLKNLYVKKTNYFFDSDNEPMEIPVVTLQAQKELSGFFYIGPILEEDLVVATPALTNLIEYGWAGLLSEWLFVMLKWFHQLTGNWGWAIIFLTFFIRLAMVPLTIPGVRSSQKMKKIQPEIEKLRQKHSGKDLESKQKLSQATFKLYKEKGVNPFSSCFTALIQMPIFIAYFSLLRSSIYLRQADWLMWVTDLSVKDATYILPIIMGVTMFLSTMAMPMPSTDPAQQKMMKFMPIMFSFMFIGMPAGLILYMITGNIFTLGQTKILNWRYDRK